MGMPVTQNKPWRVYVVNAIQAILTSPLDVFGALDVILFEHHQVHIGHAFEVAVYDASVPNGATLILALDFRAGDYAHFVFTASVGGDATVELLEGPTLAAGTPTTVFNLNRNYASYPVDALIDPTLGGAPTILETDLLPGGGILGPGATSQVRPGTERVLKPGTVYAIRATNTSGLAHPASIRMGFYIPNYVAP